MYKCHVWNVLGNCSFIGVLWKLSIDLELFRSQHEANFVRSQTVLRGFYASLFWGWGWVLHTWNWRILFCFFTLFVLSRLVVNFGLTGFEISTVCICNVLISILTLDKYYTLNNCLFICGKSRYVEQNKIVYSSFYLTRLPSPFDIFHCFPSVVEARESFSDCTKRMNF